MRNKEEIQKDIEKIKSQKDELAKRLEDLVKSREGISTSIESKKQAITKGLVTGKDPSKEIKLLSDMNIELEVTDRAIVQMEIFVDELTGKYAEGLKEFYREDLERLSAEADVFLNASLKKFYAAIDSLGAIDEKFKEIDRIGAVAGMKVDHENPHIGSLRIIYKSLRGDFHRTDGIPYMLQYIENRYSRALAEMRAKKSE